MRAALVAAVALSFVAGVNAGMSIAIALAAPGLSTAPAPCECAP